MDLPAVAMGLLLILFGFSLLVLELKLPAFGALGIAGAIGIGLGSIILARETAWGLEVGTGVIVPAAIALGAIAFFLGRLALRSQRRESVTGVEGMIGVEARVRDAIQPDAEGYVDVRGELWRAVSRAAIPAGRTVRVVDIHGLTLVVEPLEPQQGASS